MTLDLNTFIRTLLFACSVFLLTVGFVSYIKRRIYKSYSRLPSFRISFLTFYKLVSSRNTHGNATPLINFFQLICGLANLFQHEGLFFHQIGWRSFVFVHKAEYVKILINHPAALAKSAEYQFLKFVFGNSIGTSEGDVWRNHRKVANPAFGKEALTNYISVFNQRAVEMIDKFRVLTKEQWTDVSPILGNCIMNIAADSLVGMQLEGKDRDKHIEAYLKALNEIAPAGAHLMCRPWINPRIWSMFSPSGRKFFQLINDMKQSSEKVMKAKIEYYSTGKENSESNSTKGSFRNSLINMLIQYHLKNPCFTNQDVKDGVDIFLAAAYHTTYRALNWILYLVGLYNQVQEDILSEQEYIFGTDTERMATYMDLNNMKYLECVIKEAMRLYPLAPIVARDLREDVQIDNYTVPKNTTVVFNFYMLHRDPKRYPNPEEFLPRRFLPENNTNHHPFGFLPFSGGPRNCIVRSTPCLK